MPPTIDDVIARVPFLVESRDIKKTPLSGGITNLNFKVEADGQAYVIRLAGENTDKLGIRRDVEYAANYAAGQLGIAPEVVYFVEPEGYIVTRFINGRHLPPEEMARPENIMRVARKLRLFHRRGPELKGEFQIFRHVEMLARVSRSNNCKFPFDWEWIMQKTHEVEDAFSKNPHTPGPCHNDLLNLNFLDEEVPDKMGELRLLDWEYAGMGDIFFDLANFSHNHGLTDEQVRLLLQEYFGEVTPNNFARLKLMWPVSELREAMWGTTQTGISKLDEDFQGYADLWFGRLRQHVTDFRREQWLKDVQR